MDPFSRCVPFRVFFHDFFLRWLRPWIMVLVYVSSSSSFENEILLLHILSNNYADDLGTQKMMLGVCTSVELKNQWK